MSGSEVDRNLLFGVLALQMDFVGKDALIAAWTAGIDWPRPIARLRAR